MSSTLSFSVTVTLHNFMFNVFVETYFLYEMKSGAFSIYCRQSDFLVGVSFGHCVWNTTERRKYNSNSYPHFYIKRDLHAERKERKKNKLL